MAVFGDEGGGVGGIQNDLGKNLICSTTQFAVHIVLNLTRQNLSIRALSGKNQMNAKGSPQSGDGADLTGDLVDLFSVRLASAGFVKQLGHFITGKYQPRNTVRDATVQLLQIGTVILEQQLLPVFQFLQYGTQRRVKFLLPGNELTGPFPAERKINAAFKVCNDNVCSLFQQLEQEQFQKYALAAAGGTADQNMGDSLEIHCDQTNAALP